MRRIVTYGPRPSPRDEAGPAEPVEPPPVRLGTLLAGGLAPAMLGVVERGVRRRPEPARALRAEIEMAMVEDYPPIRIEFGQLEVVVEDGPARSPDARISGSLADLIALTVSPAVSGVPLPFNARGRAAVGMVVSRRVKIEGSLAVVRRLLTVIRV
jgi:hypothetical protein